MLENCTIVDTKYYEKGSKSVGRKPAKLSTFTTFYPKTKEIMNKLKSVAETADSTKEVVQTPPVNNASLEPQTQTASQVSPVAPPPVTNVVSFPTKEVLEAKLQNKDATCYSDVLPSSSGVILKSESGSVRKLRVGVSVRERQKYTTNTIGILHEPIKVDEPEVTSDKSTPFDFSQVVPTSQESVQPETSEKSIVSIDDYLSKENNEALNDEEKTTTNFHATPDNKIDDYLNGNLANVIDFDTFQKQKAEIDRKKEQLEKIRSDKEKMKAKYESFKQQFDVVAYNLNKQSEEVDQQLLEETTEYSDLQAKIIQMSDFLRENGVDNTYSSEDSYGKSKSAG